MLKRIFVIGLLGYLHTAIAANPSVGGCDIFPSDSYWNTPVINAPRHSQSDSFIAAMGTDTLLHPDFGTVYAGAPNGIPYDIVAASQSTTYMGPFDFLYWDESDLGDYPIPADPSIEGGPDSTGDRHILLLRQGDCSLFELYSAYPQTGGSWFAGSGAIYSLNSHALRPDTWTSADAAGLPILPGLVRYEEVIAGQVNHAIRFTANQVYSGYTWPARHSDGRSSSTANPPMGQRFRLKASVDISGFSARIQVILQAFKTYGLILADTGSDWYISGAPNMNWDDDELRTLRNLRGSDFEAVDMSGLMINVDSGQSYSWIDFNRDGVTDSSDLGIMMSDWGPCNPCLTDLNADGNINTSDLGVYLL